MKNPTFLLLALFLLLSVELTGQSKKLEVGADGSAGLTWMRGEGFLHLENKMTYGYSMGLTFQYNIIDFLSVRTGLSFERKGFNLKSDLTDDQGNSLGETKFRSKFFYLNLPLLIRFTLGHKSKFFFNTGVYMGYLTKQTTIIDPVNNFEGKKIHNTSDYNRFDMGLVAGMGMIIPLSEQLLLSFEARYNYGFIDINNNPNSNSIRTNLLNLITGIAYAF